MKLFSTIVLAVASLTATTQTSLLPIAIFGTPAQIQEALQAGATVDDRDTNGFTALMFAAAKNTEPVISLLLKAGAKVDDRDTYGQTALMYAARYNTEPAVISLLLKAGANAKLRSNEGETAFDYIKENKDLKDTDAFWELNNASYK